MELIGFTWVLRENSAITQVNDTNDFEALKLGGTIEWEWKGGYKPSHSLEKLVSHGVHTRILKPDGKEFQDGGFTWGSHVGKNLSL